MNFHFYISEGKRLTNCDEDEYDYEEKGRLSYREFKDETDASLLKKMKKTLREGFSPDSYNGAFLHATVKHGFFETAKLLLDYGANPDGCYYRIDDDCDIHRYPPLTTAAMCGNMKMCKLLLAYGANVFGSVLSTRTPLSCALANGHKNVARFLFNEMKKQRLLSLKKRQQEEIEILKITEQKPTEIKSYADVDIYAAYVAKKPGNERE